MEIINKKEVKTFVTVILIITVIISVVPIVMYAKQFSGNLSDDAQDWSDFGSYVGGIIGTTFSFIAVIFSFLSIYITLKIASRIYEEEEKLHKSNDLRETKKFEREIELTEKQNKPFPVVDFHNLVDKSEIKLSNQGPGTLIVTKFEIMHESKIYTDFKDLIYAKISDDEEYQNITFLSNSAKKYIIASGGSELLFELSKINHTEALFEKYRSECRIFLKEAIIKLQFEDIFENKFEIEESIGF